MRQLWVILFYAVCWTTWWLTLHRYTYKKEVLIIENKFRNYHILPDYFSRSRDVQIKDFGVRYGPEKVLSLGRVDVSHIQKTENVQQHASFGDLRMSSNPLVDRTHTVVFDHSGSFWIIPDRDNGILFQLYLSRKRCLRTLTVRCWSSQ